MDDGEHKQLDSAVSKEDDKIAINKAGNSDDADLKVGAQDEKESDIVIQKSPVHGLLDVINEQEQDQELQTKVNDGEEEGTLVAAAAADDEDAHDGEPVAEETNEAELNDDVEDMHLKERRSHAELTDEQLNLVETNEEGVEAGEEHPAAEEERPGEEAEEEGRVTGEREDRNEELGEDGDDVNRVEKGQGEDEEEFGEDGEDPEIKNVTIEEGEDGQTVQLEGEETAHEERSISQQEGEHMKREREEEEEEETRVASMGETDDMPTREELEQDRRQQLSPVISMSPRSYRSDGSARKMDDDRQMAGEEEEEEEELEETETKSMTREKLIERYHMALAERQQMQEQNYQLQHKLADFFRRKKADDSRPEDRNMADQEQRYLKCMATLDDLRQEARMKDEIYEADREDLHGRCAEKEEQVDRERIIQMEYKKQVALSAINSRTGKAIPPKDVEQYLNAESRKAAEVVTVRLENIKLKNRLRKKEAALKSKEELAEGLHLIDFEQLKIENQTYNEKIEERNEELLKLRRKITSTVQVLTHLKEKLQFVQNENQAEKTELREVEEFVGKRRDNLSRLKQARDALRFDNQNIHQKGGLLGNKALLRDFEDRKDETDELQQKLGQMRMRYAELTLNLNAVRKKIEESKSR